MRNITIIDRTDFGYIWAQYYLESTHSLEKAAHDLAVGQSIGNPNAVSGYETDEMVKQHSARVYLDPRYPPDWMATTTAGYVWIGFPRANIDWKTDGVSQLLCMLMGGQMDIDHIQICHLVKLELPHDWGHYPNSGITGLRDRTRHYGKPFLGGIIKPKTGMAPTELLEMTKALVYGGVDFIKEDEILGNPAVCPFYDRVDMIGEWFYKYDIKNVVYTFCINGDPRAVGNRYDYVQNSLNNLNLGVHLNVWSGLGQYKELRETGPLFLHYQKSGDKTFTCKEHRFHIDWKVLCYLAGICGVDSIHAGMLDGYLADDEEDMLEVVNILQQRNVIPALSCGMTPEHVAPITEKIGVDWMANVGGFIHSDPNGTEAGTRKMRDAIDNL